jgi:hypothetical protein
VAVDEFRYRRGQGITRKIKAAHNLPRDVLRGIFGPAFRSVKRHDANRVAVLAGHQVGDGGFEVGFAEIGFRECRAKRPVIVDDEIKGSERGRSAQSTGSNLFWAYPNSNEMELS